MLVIGTGRSGLVGSRIVELLSDKFNFIDFSLDTGIDITDKFVLEEAFRRHQQAKAVVHLAAFTNVDAAWQQKGNKSGSCYRVNVLGTRNIAQLCAQFNKYLIHVSTDFVFDGRHPPAGGYTEMDQPYPIEWYGETKYLAEKEVEQAGGQPCIARIAFPFRAHFPAKLDVVRRIIKGFKENSLPAMFTDQIITPTFIDDIAVAIESLINETPSGIYHLVGSTPLSPYQLACQIADVFGFDKKIIKEGSLEEYVKETGRPRQKNLSLSNQKLKKELGIEMKTIPAALQEIKSQLKKGHL